MRTERIVGINLIVIGVVLFLAGVDASRIVITPVAGLLDGATPYKAIVLMIAGALVSVVGLVKTIRGREADLE